MLGVICQPSYAAKNAASLGQQAPGAWAHTKWVMHWRGIELHPSLLPQDAAFLDCLPLIAVHLLYNHIPYIEFVRLFSISSQRVYVHISDTA